MTINSAELARKAHYAIIKDIIDIQARIVQRKALIAEFGPDAIEPEPMFIRIDSVTTAGERIQRGMEFDRERLGQLLETAREMEAVFAVREEADMEAFADYFRKTYGMGTKKGAK